MTKHITVYKPNEFGEIEKAEEITGEVVSDFEAGAEAVYNWFASVFGGNAKSQKADDTVSDGNGREWSPKRGWNYTAERGGERNPFEVHCNLVPNSDYGADSANDGTTA